MSKEKPVQIPEKKMFVTWKDGDEQGMALAMAESSNALRKVEPILRTQSSTQWSNIAPNVSVRDSFSRNDYDDFRDGESIPTKPKDIIRCCMDAYDNVGIIRNIVDLMGDFATQGIDLNHPNERIEKWYKEWFRKVGGKERSERFLNLLYRTGNVIVQRQTAKLPLKIDREMKQRAKGEADIEIQEDIKLEKREVPWRYVFHNPLCTDVVEQELSMFVGRDEFIFAIKVPKNVVSKVKNPRNDSEKELVEKIPISIRKLIANGETLIPLDSKKVKGFYYKRDDWQIWARPMCSAILTDLQVLQKMKLADLAALDGAISCIRVWKLGNIEARIMPTEAAISRLAEMLCNNVGGGVMDLVWGPEIDLIETKTDVHQFLGETKYTPVLNSIYAGLGIPPTLTGSSAAGGFTNNFISLKTLTERLQYGREILKAFWEEEIRLVQRGMGFRFPATIVFDRMVLTDEAAEKQLLINLADRNMVSTETVIERFGETPEIEMIRIRREMRKRKNGQMPDKASPFHSAEKEHEYKKIILGSGVLAPSEVGLDLDERKEGELSPAEFMIDITPEEPEQTQPKGQPGQGRPKNSNDKTKRKQKRVLPRTSATLFQAVAWAENAQQKIGSISSPAYLKSLGKKTMRELTELETQKFESYKFHVLCQLEPNEEFSEKTIIELSKEKILVPEPVKELLRATVSAHCEKSGGKEPSLEMLRRYQAGAFACWKGSFEEEDESV